MNGLRLSLIAKNLLVMTLCVTFFGCGRVSLSITDAPIDNAESLQLAISGVELQPVSGDAVKIDFNPSKLIDLLSLTDGKSAVLLSERAFPKDKYNQIKLKLDLDESFITVNGADFSFTIPTDALDGLQIDREFKVKAGSDSLFTIDFDVRKSLFDPESGSDNYILRPNLRLVDDTIAGTIQGNVDASLLGLNTECYDNSGAVAAVVYIFSGKNITADDIDGNSIEPLSSARLKQDLSYTAAFLEEGDYTLSLTCEATIDDPGTNDSIDFIRTITVKVISAQTTTLDFTL